MKFSIDGGTTWQEANEGVRVIYEDVDLPGEDERGEVQVNLTNEGIITDIWAGENYNIGTESETINELTERLVEENS